jgi:hypothetical protein
VPSDRSGSRQSLAPNGRRFTGSTMGRKKRRLNSEKDPRVYLTTVKKFFGDDQGAVKELLTVQIQWERNEKGPIRAQKKSRYRTTPPAVQLVLLAMGFPWTEQSLLDALGVERDLRTNVRGRLRKYHTSVKGVFCCRRLSARPKPCRLGVQRRTGRRPRVRSLSHGPHQLALTGQRNTWSRRHVSAATISRAGAN